MRIIPSSEKITSDKPAIMLVAISIMELRIKIAFRNLPGFIFDAWVNLKMLCEIHPRAAVASRSIKLYRRLNKPKSAEPRNLFKTNMVKMPAIPGTMIPI